MTTPPITIFWFRRDFRLWDNAALWQALKSGFLVLPIFIFDRNILDELEDKRDARVLFIHREIERLKNELEKLGSSLQVFYGRPDEVFAALLSSYNVKEVYANRDYEPYAIKRDEEIRKFLKSKAVEFKSAKDHVIFEKDEIIKGDKKPYILFTAYADKWKKTASEFYLKSYPSEKYQENFLHCAPFSLPSLKEIGFEDFDFPYFPENNIDMDLIADYAQKRDFPAQSGTSRLSLHLRFGTASIRQLCRIALIQSEKWLDELIWRDFYHMILYHFPYSANSSFRRQFDEIEWSNDVEDFEKWCVGKTGYPIVDAGMRELNETGFMHNRVRMVVASFLSKHLLIDWRWGEQYFAKKLLDYDLASNVGGWQWVVGSGCDGAPYFRIFSPDSQAKRFDPQKEYIKKWVPEVETKDYPQPMIDHKIARLRCLVAFKKALGNSNHSI